MKNAIEFENLYSYLLKLDHVSYQNEQTNKIVSSNRFAMLYIFYQINGVSNIPESINLAIGPNMSSNMILSQIDDSNLKSQESQESHESNQNNNEIQPLKNHFILAKASESQLVRDLIYVIQGINGEFIKYEKSSDSYKIDPNFDISRSNMILAYRISELGWLFLQLQKYLKSTETVSGNNKIGLVEQSFREGILEEVKSYYKMVSVLENQINQGIPMTLKKISVWTWNPLRRLKWICTVIDIDKIHDSDASTLSSSRIQRLNVMRNHGDPYVQSLGKILEIHTSRPLLSMIANWISQGFINDPYNEFFIIKNDFYPREARISHVGKATQLDSNYWKWENQFILINDRIPPFISLKLAQKILVIGKSINLMKLFCNDSDWIAKTTFEIISNLDNQELVNFDQLRTPIHLLSQKINQRLLYLILDQFHLMEHLEAIKKYLFLGQGDLIQVLMENLSSELSLPAGKQYLHNILPIIDGSIRSSVAHSWPSYIQDQCEVYLPSPKELDSIRKTNNEITNGWDIFELNYRLIPSLNAVFGSQKSILQHKQIFKFLWRLRRIQILLSATWRLTTNLTKQISDSVPEIIPILQTHHILRHQMNHFISNIEYYIMFEVIESAWAIFETKVKSAKSLDDVIVAYSYYMETIIKSSLVDDPSIEKISLNDQVDQGFELENTPAMMIWEILDIIQEFDNQVKVLYQASYEISLRREKISQDGQKIWEKEDEQADQDFIEYLNSDLQIAIDTIKDKYNYNFNQLFSLLAQKMQENDNVYLRNLFQRINFNSYYANESSSFVQPNPESATLELQKTIYSIRKVPIDLTSDFSPNSTNSENKQSSSEYTQDLFKKAAAKLRLEIDK